MNRAADPPVLFEVDGGVAWITLNRPEKRNALDSPTIEKLKGYLAEAERNESVRVVAVRGAGEDFCSGADLAQLRGMMDADTVGNIAEVDALAELFLAPRRMSKPVVAVVHGRALAGGSGLATACDMVLAARGATFGYPEVHIGFVPAMVMAILRRNLPEKRAFELVVGGARVGAEEAERIGLINRVYADESFEEEAARYLEELAARSPSAVALSKRLLYHQDGMGFEAALRAGADVNVIARMTPDTRAGVARFLDRSGGR